MRRAGFIVVIAACMLAGSLAASGCGGSSSDGSSSQELEAARSEGEEAAREKATISRLQHQVHRLQREVHRGSHTVVVERHPGVAPTEPTNASSSVLRIFHAPSGNVSCEILVSGATCAVASIDETFTFSDGQEARIESGTMLARGTGELAPYGSIVSAGSVTCSIPQSDEPRGITCSDSESGHGFEASRVSDRQSVY